MKTKCIIILGLVLVILLPLGNNVFATKKEERKVDDFSSVSLQIAAKMYLKQGSTYKVVIEAESDLLENIETEVLGKTLKIKLKKWYKQRNEKATVYITMPDIEGLSIGGSGSIIAENEINTDELDLSISGSGNMQLNQLKANDIQSSISGSGSLYLAGKGVVKFHTISISGSGNVKSAELQVEDVDARISGSGNCKVYVIENLDAVVSGSGKIYYKGNPRIDANISGSGNVRSLD